MAEVTVTAASISEVIPQYCEVVSVKLAEAVATAGLPAYQTTTGTFGIADANDAAKEQFRGVFLEAGGTGDVVRLLKRGYCNGFNVSSMNCDAPIYLSDSVGKYDDGAGTVAVICGIVALVPGTSTKAVYIEARWTHIWS